ncbi:MAG: FAD-binding oxidoreductase [Xenococcaceae cyanobacterium MO_188.B19]|nr:FAD-binding oxidoreductase [Xenococcaceae cyanobacterium MO_188.B19]
MNTNYDWIVIGGGITGSSLAYELSLKQLKVLLLEKDTIADNATVYSYGGLAYWSGTTELTRRLSQEGIELHRQLSSELDGDTEFRELDLLLTCPLDHDLKTIAKNYADFAIQPDILDAQQACDLEPLLNPNSVSGALRLPHGHINPQKTAIAYQQAFLRQGGRIIYERADGLLRKGDSIVGVVTDKNTYYSPNTVVCAGGLSRRLLTNAGITSNIFFTHSLLIKTPPTDIKLSTIVMPAIQQRFTLEATAKDLLQGSSWDDYHNESIKSILDAGAVQFLDGSLCLGQISAVATNPGRKLDKRLGENSIRQKISSILPMLSNVPGTCASCLVAFTNQGIAVVGNVKDMAGIYLFNGFTSTLVFAPPLAKHFANWVTGKDSQIIQMINVSS